MEELFGQHKTPREILSATIYDRKLSVALRESRLTNFFNRYNSQSSTEDDLFLLSFLRYNDIEHCLKTPEAYPKMLLEYILSDNIPQHCKKGNRAWFFRSWNLAKQNLAFQQSYMTKQNQVYLQKGGDDAFKTFWAKKAPPKHLLNLSVFIEECNQLINRINHIATIKKYPTDPKELQELKNRCFYIFKSTGITIQWSKKLALITFPNQDIYVVPKEYLLLIHNKASDAMSVLLLACINEEACYPLGTSNALRAYIIELCNLAIKYKNNFCEIASSIEGLVVAETLVEVDGIINNDLLVCISRELFDAIGFDYENSQLREILTGVDIAVRHEFGCCSKLMGHPYIDLKAGAMKIHKRTTTVKKINLEVVTRCTCLAKENYIRNHIMRHKRWPPVSFKRIHVGNAIYEAWKVNKDPRHVTIADKYGSYSLDDWNAVDIEQNMNLNMIDNYLPELKDRTISLLRSRVVERYINHTYDRPARWEETRLLLYYLMNTMSVVDHHAYLQKYLDSVDLHELIDYLVLRMVPKELEEKRLAREFGCKTYEDRTRMSVQCHNVKHFLDLYSDEQAMTLGELDILKRLNAFRNLHKAYPGHSIIYINLDCSGWNNSFRHESVSSIVKETLDKVFGVDLFRKTHFAYREGFFYTPDEVETYFWQGQEGGIEGLDQDTWVWVYINQVKQAMLGYNFSYHVFCKGDDFRIAIIVPDKHLLHRSLLDWKNDIVANIAAIVQTCGHDIKIAESYGSPTYFTFSKSASCGRIQLPETFRKIQKVYGASNAFMSTLDDYVAVTFSNAHSTCQVGVTTHGPYVVALVWAYYYLLHNPHYSKLSDSQLVCLLLVPSLLGGFPIIYLHNMHVRAESDLLSPFIDIVMYAKDNYHTYYQILRRFFLIEKTQTNDKTRVFIDPYSLPIKTPTSATAYLKGKILPEIKRLTRNEQVKELFQASNSPYSKTVVEIMSDADPLPVRIFSVIYSALPVGVLRELCARFESGKSIVELIVTRRGGGWRHAERLIISALKGDDRLQKWRASKIAGSHTSPYKRDFSYVLDLSCPCEAAQELRNVLWGCEITSVTMPPLAHQLWIKPEPERSTNVHDMNNHFLFIHHQEFKEQLGPFTSDHWKVSDQKPFLGHTTKTGYIEPKVNFIEKDVIIVKVKNLLDLKRWCTKDIILSDGTKMKNNIPDLIDNTLNFYTEGRSTDLDPYQAGKKSETNTVQHHVRSPHFKEAIMPNQRSNIYQQFSGHSNTHNTMVTSGDHFLINFLHVYCWSIHSISNSLEYSEHVKCPHRTWVVTNNCLYCAKPISEPGAFVDLNNLPLDPEEPIQACRISEIAKEIVTQSLVQYANEDFCEMDPVEEMTREWAATGVVQETVSQTYKVHCDIQTRHTQHSLTGTQQAILTDLSLHTTTRIVSSTELKKIPPYLFISPLSAAVAEFIDIHFHKPNVAYITSMFSTIPGSELPWYKLTELLLSINKLIPILNEIVKVTKIRCPMVYDNTSTAATYIGQALALGLFHGKLTPRACIMSYRPLADSGMFVKQYGEALRWQTIHNEYISFIKSKVYQQQSHDVQLRLAKTILVALSATFTIEDNIDEISHAIRFQKDLSSIILPNEYDPMLLDDMCQNGDILSPTTPGAQYIIMNHPHVLWSEAYDEIMNGDFHDEMETLTRYIKSCHVRLFRTEISECINFIRASVSSDDDDSSATSESDLEIINEVNTPSAQLNRPHKINRRELLIVGRHVGLPTKFSTKVEYARVEHKIRFQQCYNHRTLGSGTSSSNKIMDVLHALGYGVPLGKDLRILTLGEGYGGIMECLASITRSSTFGFCTLPPSPDVMAVPAIAQEALQRNQHLLLDDNMKGGLHDLRKSVTVNWFREHFPYVNVLICDAELPEGCDEDSQVIMSNVVSLFSNVALYDSLLIYKCSLHDLTLVCKCIYSLKEAGCVVRVMKPPSSGVNGEIYITATHFMGTKIYDIGAIPPSYPGSLEAEIIVFANDVMGSFFPLPKPRVVYLNKDAQVFTRLDYFRYMNPLYENKLLSVCGVTIRFRDIVNDRSTVSSLLDHCIAKATDHARYIRSILNEDVRVMKRRRWDDNTHTHFVILSLRYLALMGLLNYLDLITQTGATEEDLRAMFLEDMKTLPPRVIPKEWDNTIWTMNYTFIPGKRLNPFFTYMEGVRVGQSFYHYCEVWYAWKLKEQGWSQSEWELPVAELWS